LGVWLGVRHVAGRYGQVGAAVPLAGYDQKQRNGKRVCNSHSATS